MIPIAQSTPVHKAIPFSRAMPEAQRYVLARNPSPKRSSVEKEIVKEIPASALATRAAALRAKDHANPRGPSCEVRKYPRVIKMQLADHHTKVPGSKLVPVTIALKKPIRNPKVNSAHRKPRGPHTRNHHCELIVEIRDIRSAITIANIPDTATYHAPENHKDTTGTTEVIIPIDRMHGATRSKSLSST